MLVFSVVQCYLRSFVAFRTRTLIRGTHEAVTRGLLILKSLFNAAANLRRARSTWELLYRSALTLMRSVAKH